MYTLHFGWYTLRPMRFFFSLFFTLLFSISCAQPSRADRKHWIAEKNKIRVLCSTEQISCLVRLVGKDLVSVYTLISPSCDPHAYQPTKSDKELLSSADILFFCGLGFEHQVLFSKCDEHSSPCFISEELLRRYPNRILFVGRSPDPHVWMDVSLWAEAIDIVKESLLKKRPKQKREIEENAQAGKERLRKLHTTLTQRLSHIPSKDRFLVTTHESFRYFVYAYLSEEIERQDGSWTKRCCAPEGLAPEGQVSLLEMEQLVHHIEKYDIRILFPEYGVNKDALKRLVEIANHKGMGVRLSESFLRADSPGFEGGYEEMVVQDANILARELQEK